MSGGGRNQHVLGDDDNDNLAADSALARGVSTANGIMSKLFASCADDPKGSVHRAWGISLIFVVIYFILSVVEMVNIHAFGGSKALVVASIWTGLVHLVLGVLGTFVLKRFPTSFSVGFLLGVLVVLANQNLIMFGTFHGYSFGTPRTNHAFANLSLSLFCVLLFFAVLLNHFRTNIVVQQPPEGHGGHSSGSRSHHHNHHHHHSSGGGGQVTEGNDSSSDHNNYVKYNEEQA